MHDVDITCTKCTKTFTCARSRDNHVKEFHGKSRPTCGKCGKEFRNDARKDAHEQLCGKRLAPDEPIAQCPYCQKQFADAESMKRHRRKFHSDMRAAAAPAKNTQEESAHDDEALRQVQP